MTVALRNSRGFTLIEILVVMAIIVALAGMSFWGIREILTSQKIHRTRAVVQAVSSAIMSFHNQYLEWPTDALLNSLNQEWYEFLNRGYVQAKESGRAKFEARGKFLELPDSSLSTAGEIIDDWKNLIAIEVDPVKGAVLVYSFGPDGVAGTPDDITGKL